MISANILFKLLDNLRTLYNENFALVHKLNCIVTNLNNQQLVLCKGCHNTVLNYQDVGNFCEFCFKNHDCGNTDYCDFPSTCPHDDRNDLYVPMCLFDSVEVPLEISIKNMKVAHVVMLITTVNYYISEIEIEITYHRNQIKLLSSYISDVEGGKFQEN